MDPTRRECWQVDFTLESTTEGRPHQDAVRAYFGVTADGQIEMDSVAIQEPHQVIYEGLRLRAWSGTKP